MRTEPHGPSGSAVGCDHAEAFFVLIVGDHVQVFSAFEGTWVRGFAVDAILGEGVYRLRRLSDGSLLPDATGGDDLRPV